MLKNILGLIVLSGLLFSGCKKCDCADPLDSGTFTKTFIPGSEGKDAYINSAITSMTSNPTDERLFLMAGTWSGTPGAVRSFIQFDYSSIPSGAIITSAKLTLYADTSDIGIGPTIPYGHSTLSGDNNWYIQRITSSWAENGITWANQPATDPVGQINLPGTTDRAQSYTIDITHFVKDEFENPTLYHGLMMRLDTEGYYRGVMFCSSDHRYAALHPKLELTYTIPQ